MPIPLHSLHGIRTQTAVVRSLVDTLEHVVPHDGEQSLEGQLVEELSRLGCRVLEAAEHLAKGGARSPEESGIFPAIRISD